MKVASCDLFHHSPVDLRIGSGIADITDEEEGFEMNRLAQCQPVFLLDGMDFSMIWYISMEEILMTYMLDTNIGLMVCCHSHGIESKC